MTYENILIKKLCYSRKKIVTHLYLSILILLIESFNTTDNNQSIVLFVNDFS